MLTLMESGAFPVKVGVLQGLVASSNPTPYPEPILVHSSDGLTKLGCVADGKIQRPPERQYRNQGEIGHITKNRIDKEVLYQKDPQYLAPLRRIMSECGFLEAVRDRDGLSKVHKRVSRFMIHHEDSLCDMGILEPADDSDGPVSVFLPLFTVRKKSGDLRLIQDGRELNKLFERPEHMCLPTIHEVINRVLDSSYVSQCDAVSYFYQFGLDHEVRKYFSARLAGARGIFHDFQMTSMPMGWSHAPLIAQRSSNVLVRDLGVAWVDNFFILGNDKVSFENNKEMFLRRAREVNLELDSEELPPLTEIEALGVHFDLINKRYRMEPAWAEKAGQRLENILCQEKITVLDLYVLSGTLTWRCHVVNRRLCNLPHIFQSLGKVAQQVTSGTKQWSSVIELTEDFVKEARSEIKLLSENPWVFRQVKSDPTAEVWSDASDKYWAFLLFERDSLVYGRQGNTKEELHIYYSELSAALGAIMAAKRRGHKSIRVYVDNAPAAHALRRGVSSNFRACKWLAYVQDLELEVIWVSTRQQLADKYTRKRVDDDKPPPIPRTGTKKSDLIVDALGGITHYGNKQSCAKQRET